MGRGNTGFGARWWRVKGARRGRRTGSRASALSPASGCLQMAISRIVCCSRAIHRAPAPFSLFVSLSSSGQERRNMRRSCRSPQKSEHVHAKTSKARKQMVPLTGRDGGGSQSVKNSRGTSHFERRQRRRGS